jgi:hypothetical protein
VSHIKNFQLFSSQHSPKYSIKEVADLPAPNNNIVAITRKYFIKTCFILHRFLFRTTSGKKKENGQKKFVSLFYL